MEMKKTWMHTNSASPFYLGGFVEKYLTHNREITVSPKNDPLNLGEWIIMFKNNDEDEELLILNQNSKHCEEESFEGLTSFFKFLLGIGGSEELLLKVLEFGEE